MKNSILFYLLMVSALSRAQSHTYAYHDGIASSFEMVGLNGKTYHLEKTIVLNKGCTDAISLVCIQNGKKIFSKQVAAGAFMSNARIALSPQNEIMVSCGTHWAGCDYTTTSFHLVKLDTLGNILWKIKENFPLSDIVVMPDSSVYVFGNNNNNNNNNNYVLIYSGSGQLVGGLSGLILEPVTSVHSIAPYDSSHFIMNYDYQGNKLLIIASDLSTSTPVAVAGTMHAMRKMAGGGLAALSGTDLHIYSPSFVFKKSSAATLTSHTINAYTQRNDSFFVTGVDAQNKPFFAVLDTQLVVLHIFSPKIADGYGTGIYVEGPAVHFITTGGVRKNTHSFTTHLQTAFSVTASPGKDIGVSSASINSSNLYGKFGTGTDGYYVYILSADVIVKNFGSDTVKAFRLNHFSRDFFPWGYKNNGLNKSYKATVAPGGTVSVSTGTFYSTFDVFGATSGTFAANVCFNSTVPDSVPDLDHLNDAYCAGLVGVTTAINEMSNDESFLKLYPNPAASGFHVESAQTISSIEVYDLSGRLLKSYPVNTRVYFVATEEFHKGLYLIKINTGETTTVRKILLE